jgi:hypothetical protein
MADNTQLNTGLGGDIIAADDIGAVKYQRVKLIHGIDGVNDGDIAKANPLPVFNINTAKATINLWAVAAAAGATGVEAAINLIKSGVNGAAPAAAAASIVLTNGKRFRVTSMAFSSRGNVTATAQNTVFSVRVNNAGAVTTTSNAWFSVKTETPASALAQDRYVVDFGNDGPELAADTATFNIGVTAKATFVTNAPVWDVAITGYEY